MQLAILGLAAFLSLTFRLLHTQTLNLVLFKITPRRGSYEGLWYHGDVTIEDIFFKLRFLERQKRIPF